MAIPTTLRRFLVRMGTALAGVSMACVLGAQTMPPLTTSWSPGAVPGGGGIVIPAFPVVTGEPFTANDDSRRIEVQKGKRITQESHGVVARDSEGRIAVRTSESPHVALPVPGGRGSTFVPAGGSISDPVAMVHLQRTESGPLLLNDVVLKNRIVRTMPQYRPAVLNPCERGGDRSRPYTNGITQQIESVGERTIQGILTEGCRVTTHIPAGVAGNDHTVTNTDEWWSSPLYRITLLHTMHNSEGMEEIEQLDDLVLGAPDSSLFRPPSGYTIRDMDAERKREERSEFTVMPGEPDAEQLAGYWEGGDPFGGSGEIGILLKISANRRAQIQGGRTTATDPEKFIQFDVGLYTRISGEVKIGWFSIPWSGQRVMASWNGHRLQLKSDGNRPDGFMQGEVAVEVSFNQPTQSWRGKLSRNGETKSIVLMRPGGSVKALSNPFLGRWAFVNSLQRGLGGSTCIDIEEGSDGTVLAWGDSRTPPAIDPRQGPNFASMQETDGDAWGAEANANMLTLQQGIYWAAIAGLPPVKIRGKLTAGGFQILGTVEGPAPPERQPTSSGSVILTRLSRKSCWTKGQN